jgi:hypothetical protein
MTAYELVDGKYYPQGSQEHLLALENKGQTEYPTIPTERVIVRLFWPVRKVLPPAVVRAGLRR